MVGVAERTQPTKTITLCFLALAALGSACVEERIEPSGWDPSPLVEEGVFWFQGVSAEHRRWYQARYADFTSEFGVELPPGQLIFIAPGNHGPAECLPVHLPGRIEVHPCRIPGGYKLICDGHRECPLRFAELLANLAEPRSAFLRDGLADIIAGGVTTPHAFDFEFEDYESRVQVFMDDVAYEDENRGLHDLYEHDWYRSKALHYSLRRTAARFVAFLIGRVGPRRGAQLLRLSSAEWREPSNQQLIDAFATAPPTDGRSHARLAVECASPALAVGADLSIDLSAGAPIYDAVAPSMAHTQARSFDVSEPATLHLRLESGNLPFFHLQSCATGISLRHVNALDIFHIGSAEPLVSAQVDVSPGRYVLIIGLMTSSLTGPESLQIRLDLVPPSP